MTLQTETQTGRVHPAPKTKSGSRALSVGLAAAFLLSCSPLALHAEVSNAELAKEIAELKAQLRSLKGGVAEAKKEARSKRTTVVAAPASTYAALPPAFTAIPPGATPVYATADKKMIFGNLTITPGGFIETSGIYRTRNINSDVASAFNQIPFNNSNLAHQNETRIDPRGSRAALLVEAPIAKNLLVAGYAELDMEGAGTTSTLGQYSAYVPRIRNLYTTLDANDYGLHVLAGQNWSLMTINSKGITPRNEVLPAVIDFSFVPGFENARTPQIRLVKDFDKKLWVGLSVESPQTSISGNCISAASNVGTAIPGVTTPTVNAVAAAPVGATITGLPGVTGTCVAPATGGFFGSGPTAESLSLNKVPDVLGKIAYEARFANRDVHVEATGIYRQILDNPNYGTVNPVTGFPFSTNQTTNAYGVEGAVVAPIIPTRLDFQAGGTFGRGLGRYSNSGLPDATLDGSGKLRAIGTANAFAGLIAHVTPSIDIYAYVGFEQVNRAFSTVAGGGQVGYGTTGGVTNTGCFNEGGTCGAVTHRIAQLTGGFSDKLYKGYFGEVRVGAQYSYTERYAFGATANATGIPTAAAPFVSAKQNDQMVFTDLRYYPFQ